MLQFSPRDDRCSACGQVQGDGSGICVGPAPLNSVACGDRADHHRYQPIRDGYSYQNLMTLN